MPVAQCTLLLTELRVKELLEPVLTPYLLNSRWNWCVRLSVKRENERMRKEQGEEEYALAPAFSSRVRDPRGPRAVYCLKGAVACSVRRRRLRQDK
jgi:hypothetical protein